MGSMIQLPLSVVGMCRVVDGREDNGDGHGVEQWAITMQKGVGLGGNSLQWYVWRGGRMRGSAAISTVWQPRGVPTPVVIRFRPSSSSSSLVDGVAATISHRLTPPTANTIPIDVDTGAGPRTPPAAQRPTPNQRERLPAQTAQIPLDEPRAAGTPYPPEGGRRVVACAELHSPDFGPGPIICSAEPGTKGPADAWLRRARPAPSAAANKASAPPPAAR